MAEDLKRQALELYRERSDETIPTSDSLSIRKIVYVSVGLLAALTVLIYGFGGFKPRTDPVTAAATPRTVTKQPFPPDSQAIAPPPQSPIGPSPAETKPSLNPETTSRPLETPAEATRKAEDAFRVAEKRAPTANSSERKKSAREQATPALSSAGTTSQAKVGETKPLSSHVQEPSPVELARQELARDLVLEKSAAMARMVNSQDANLDYRGWKSTADSADEYQVVFTFQDRPSGALIQYIWRVHVVSRTVTPQSYYARKVS